MVLIPSQESRRGNLPAASLSSSLTLASVSPGGGREEPGILGADLSPRGKPGEMFTGCPRSPVTPRKVQTERCSGPYIAFLCLLKSQLLKEVLQDPSQLFLTLLAFSSQPTLFLVLFWILVYFVFLLLGG